MRTLSKMLIYKRDKLPKTLEQLNSRRQRRGLVPFTTTSAVKREKKRDSEADKWSLQEGKSSYIQVNFYGNYHQMN